VRQYRYAIGKWIWELPAGTLDPGESARAAARRECAEEIGLSPRRVEKLGEFYPTPGFCDEVMIFYRCSGLERPKRPAALDPDEQLEPRAFTLAQVRQLIKRRQVVDMKTIVGLTLLGRG
jgi:ADP-ribose pyrophosphatase